MITFVSKRGYLCRSIEHGVCWGGFSNQNIRIACTKWRRSNSLRGSEYLGKPRYNCILCGRRPGANWPSMARITVTVLWKKKRVVGNKKKKKKRSAAPASNYITIKEWPCAEDLGLIRWSLVFKCRNSMYMGSGWGFSSPVQSTTFICNTLWTVFVVFDGHVQERAIKCWSRCWWWGNTGILGDIL